MSEWVANRSISKQKLLEVISIISIGLIGSGLHKELFIIIMLMTMRYVLVRSFWESVLLLAACFLQFYIDPDNLILFYSIMLGIYLFFQLLRFFHLDSYKLICLTLTLIILAYLIWIQIDIKKALLISLSAYGLMQLDKDEKIQIVQEYFPKPAYSIALLAIMMLIAQIAPSYSMKYFVLLFTLICAYEKEIRIIFAYLLLLALGFEVLHPIYFFIFIASMIRKDKFLLTSLTGIYLVLFTVNQLELYLILAAWIFYLVLDEGKQIMTETEYVTHNQKALIQRQLVSFSQIFESMSSYYEPLSQSESRMLLAMSEALDEISRNFIQEENQLIRQIEDMLIGYKIEYELCSVKQDEQGRYSIQLGLYHFRKSEVKEVLLPLLNSLLPIKVQLSGVLNHQHIIGLTTYEFCSEKPIKLDISADSCKHSDISGDYFSVFQHEQICYCLISDGMGYGSQAFKISSCISTMFQRMILAGIDSRKALECINHLLQSDIFATMDLLAFDRIRKTVRLSKSAASPTYLIRKNELYAITSHSLPIGIVAKVNVDSIELEIEENDWFLMSSDGVYMEEIIEWMKTRKNQDAREETERFMQILNRQPRKDDSTILLIRVM